MSTLPPETDRLMDEIFDKVDATFEQMRPVFDELSTTERKVLKKFFISFVNRVHRRRRRQKLKIGFFDALAGKRLVAPLLTRGLSPRASWHRSSCRGSGHDRARGSREGQVDR
jgi:hypothetical protein